MNPEVPAALADDLIERFAARGLDVQYLEGQRVAHPDVAVRRVPAALLLRAAGFKLGDRWGPVQLSDKHVLAIVTHDGATADDVWQALSHVVRNGCSTRPEWRCTPNHAFVGEFQSPTSPRSSPGTLVHPAPPPTRTGSTPDPPAFTSGTLLEFTTQRGLNCNKLRVGGRSCSPSPDRVRTDPGRAGTLGPP